MNATCARVLGGIIARSGMVGNEIDVVTVGGPAGSLVLYPAAGVSLRLLVVIYYAIIP